ncbi:hypothetical protein AcV5_007352 [Taiwanofungus camphoratus]|nr:hypothetical protein AcV5_007352 [Antrodia cinnamomea]
MEAGSLNIMLIGEDIVSEYASETQVSSPVNKDVPSVVFTKKDLKHIQDDVARTTRPLYSSGPPPTIGTKAHGKLKADEWKAGVEFELPVSLIKWWYRDGMTDLPAYEAHRHSLAHSTMLLTCAV